MCEKEQAWTRICSLTDQAFGISNVRRGVGLEGWFEPELLRQLADILDSYDPDVQSIKQDIAADPAPARRVHDR